MTRTFLLRLHAIRVYGPRVRIRRRSVRRGVDTLNLYLRGEPVLMFTAWDGESVEAAALRGLREKPNFVRAWLAKWLPIDRASRKSPLRQVVEHVASVVWLPVMVVGCWRVGGMR